jgi:RecB family exonuclease
LNVAEEPEERDMMDAATRGTLVHAVLERFFRAQKERGRPRPNEEWTDEDRDFLMSLLDDEMATAEMRGLTGLSVYARHEARMIGLDLARFLDADTAFRRETGAVPAAFEVPIPEVQVAGVALRGVADRVDRTPDGGRAWVIDYKTGSMSDFSKIKPEDPLAGGTKLQLPVYLGAVRDAAEAHSLYWFITQRGNFKRIPYEPTARNQKLLKRTLEAVVLGIRAGAFLAWPGEEDTFSGGFKNCTFCDFARICSRRRDEEFEAKSQDPAADPWLAVARAARGEDGG